MILPPTCHLPGAPAQSPQRPLAGTGLGVPELGPGAVERVWRALDAGAAAWRTRSLDHRVQALERVARQLGARGPGRWREILARSAGLSAAGLQAAWEVTFAPHDAAALREALRVESIDDARLATLEGEGRLPRRLVHVLAGNVLPPAFTMLVRGWLLGAAQWLRPAAREPLFVACLLEDLREIAPELCACTAVLWWPHEGSPTEAAVLAAADAITLQGDDSSLAAFETKVSRLRPAPRFLGYGSRWSAALVSGAAQTPETARAIALDVALFDQQGCLSPSIVFAERTDGLEAWCSELARALATLQGTLPRGVLTGAARAALRHWHEDMRLGVALGEIAHFWEPDGSTAWGLALLRVCRSADTPLDRHVVVAPFAHPEQITEGFGSRLRKLQGLGIALDGWSQERCDVVVQRLGPTRAATAGTLQLAPPAWPQDHRPPLGSLLGGSR